MDNYEESLKVYRDLKGVIDTSYEDGLEQGIEKGMKQGIEKGMKQGMEKGIEQATLNVVKNALKKGLSLELISELTGLPVEEIEKL